MNFKDKKKKKKKKNVLFPETRLTLPFCPRLNFFRHNLHSVKIGVRHSIVSVQRQHGKTGVQVNHVVVFFPNVRIGDRYSRKCSDIIAGSITFIKYKGQVCNTVPSISLFGSTDRKSYLQTISLKKDKPNSIYCIQ